MITGYGITLAMLFIVTQATIFSSVTVSPCSRNKIAPHRRNSQVRSSRTFGNFESEETDLDDDNDCLGINQQLLIDNRPNQITQEKFFENWFPNLFGRPPYPPQYPQNPNLPPVTSTLRPPSYYPSPVSTVKPTRPPKRPPQGGYFGNNNYNPPNYFSPSNDIKPAHENTQETYQPSYFPSVVGGNVNQIVGVSPGTVPQRPGATRLDMPYPSPPRHGIIGSFVDLLFL